MSTITALFMWVLVSAGVVNHGCYDAFVGPDVDIVEPPPPPSDADSQCILLDGQSNPRRSQISNGF